MVDLRCWEIKGCNHGPDSDQPCVVVNFDLSDGFLGSKKGAKACFYIKGTTCFEDDKDMKIPEKLATYCMDCDVYKIVTEEHGSEANLFYYIKFLHEKLENNDQMHNLPMINENLF